MGMFDTVRVEYPFPDASFQDAEFQTKDLECRMESYTITAEGQLVLHESHLEFVPDEQRPNYGTPEWGRGGFYQAMGMFNQVADGDVMLTDMHGDIYLSASRGRGKDWQYFRWRVRFTHGKVEEIRLVDSPDLRPLAAEPE